MHHLLSLVVPHCECAGCILGLLGAFLLATHTRFSPLGWISFLAANAAMITFAYGVGAYWLLWQQVGFTATSCLGLWRSRSSLIDAFALRNCAGSGPRGPRTRAPRHDARQLAQS